MPTTGASCIMTAFHCHKLWRRLGKRGDRESEVDTKYRSYLMAENRYRQRSKVLRHTSHKLLNLEKCKMQSATRVPKIYGLRFQEILNKFDKIWLWECWFLGFQLFVNLIHEIVCISEVPLWQVPDKKNIISVNTYTSKGITDKKRCIVIKIAQNTVWKHKGFFLCIISLVL